MSQMAGKNPSRPITEDNARKFEQGLGLPKGWLDIERTPYGQPVENTPPPETQDKPICKGIDGRGMRLSFRPEIYFLLKGCCNYFHCLLNFVSQ